MLHDRTTDFIWISCCNKCSIQVALVLRRKTNYSLFYVENKVNFANGCIFAMIAMKKYCAHLNSFSKDAASFLSG